jgi:DMSO/TMAO reductase YedYZ molybdopterin-dependent catalytic subunit
MDANGQRVTRRRILAGAFLTGAAWLLKACGLTLSPTVTPAVSRTDTQAPPATVVSAPSPTAAAAKILQNDNPDEFWVRYYRPFPAPDRTMWHLEVTGLVENPVTLDYDQVLSLPSFTRTSRMKCVECWSGKATWEGFQYPSLATLVKPASAATALRFDCADGYTEYLEISDLEDPRVIFVTRMNGALLPDEYGAPLRMIVPWKYGYKGAKAITRLTFVDKSGAGYWPRVGGYSTVGDIQPGFDQPLDLPGTTEHISGGEITQY